MAAYNTYEPVGEQGVLLWVATTHVGPTELTHCPGAMWPTDSVDQYTFACLTELQGLTWAENETCFLSASKTEISFLFLSEASLEDIAQYLKQITFLKIYMYIFQILFSFRLLQNIKQRSLCSKVGPCWLSILNIAVCTCQSQTP